MISAKDCEGCLGFSGPPCGCTCHVDEALCPPFGLPHPRLQRLADDRLRVELEERRKGFDR